MIGLIFPIYIQNKNHEDLAVESVASAVSSKTSMIKLGIVNRYYDYKFDEDGCDIDDLDMFQHSELRKQLTEIIINDENCLAKAWNIGYEALKDKCSHIIFSNTDVIMNDQTINKFIKYSKLLNDEVVVISATKTNNRNQIIYTNKIHELNHNNMWDQYSLFMVKNNFQKLIGEFDENFKPAYYEDIDIQYRIELAGKKNLVIEDIEYIHYQSSTIQLHEDKQWAWENLSSSKSHNYMTLKWGGTRHDIKHTTPYDLKDKDFKFIHYSELATT